MIMNPFEVLKSYMKRGMTPKGIVLSVIDKNNPVFGNLISMAESGNNQEVEKFARNFLKERGINYDTEMDSMKKILNIQ